MEASPSDNLKMSSVQERLQLKRVPLDTWNTREQLCLASAVVRSGDQNWMSVSRTLKTIGDPNRPADWYSQKSCAAQYGALLEHVETPKRKKRNSEGAAETPQESILKRLTQERIDEIQRTVNEMNHQCQTLRNEITEVRNPATTDDRIKDLWNTMEVARKTREKEIAKRAAWLREREERRNRSERQWRVPVVTSSGSPTTPTGNITPTSSAAPSSPLLTSLLKSSPVVTTPQMIPHPATVVDTISPSAGAPTLSMLLEKSAPHPTAHANKLACIEHIKSQLVQLEHQLAAGPTLSMLLEKSAPLPTAHPNKLACIEHIQSQLVQLEHQLAANSPQPATVEAPDIDDIVLATEDVYAFRDVELPIHPSLSHIHPVKQRRISDSRLFKRMDEDLKITDERDAQETEGFKEDATVQNPQSEDEPINVETLDPPDIPKPPEKSSQYPVAENMRISFPEVKFPTLEIKVIQPDEVHVPVPVPISVPVSVPLTMPEVSICTDNSNNDDTSTSDSQQMEIVSEESSTDAEPMDSTESQTEAPEPESEASSAQNEAEENESKQEEQKEQTEQTEQKEQEEQEDQEEVEKRALKFAEGFPMIPLPTDTPNSSDAGTPPPPADQENLEDTNQSTEGDIDDNSTMETLPKDTPGSSSAPDEAETHTETDDDTPMELVREEEKDGRKKKDYSRKKKADSRTCSGSSSATETSAPDSPTTSDDRQHRLWKKSVMLVYSRLCAHKYASLFLRPITDDQAPGYSVLIKRPMDLGTIKRNIDNGVIRTTAEFQRDVLLMLSNALMYNSSEHRVYQMTQEMFKEAESQLGMLLAAQAHAGLPSSSRSRRSKQE